MSDSSDVDVSDEETYHEQPINGISGSDDDDEEEEEVVVSSKKKRRNRSETEDDDDDDEEEDEEEEEEEERPRKKPKRKRKRLVAQFINEEVEVDDDDDDDDYYNDTGSEFGVDPREREEVERIMREQDRQYAQRNRFADMSEEQLAEYFKNRYESINATNDDYFDSVAEEDLPGIQGPHLFIVKCRLGQERNLCLQLMRKYLAFADSDKPLEILSMAVKDNVKGMVYIEAYKTPHVLKAIEGISAFTHRNDIKMVPRIEMIDTLKIVREIPQPKKKKPQPTTEPQPLKFLSMAVKDNIEAYKIPQVLKAIEGISAFTSVKKRNQLPMKIEPVLHHQPSTFNAFGGNMSRRNKQFIGKNVRIKGGPYKGYYGIVKDATDAVALVELHANCKTQQFDITRLEEVGSVAGVGPNYKHLAKTPSSTARTPYGAYQTPMHGAQTPMHIGGNRTPFYGGQTPAYNNGGRTPAFNDGGRTRSHISAWDPSGFATPAYDDGRTRSSSFATPAYDGGRTRSHTSAWDPSAFATPAHSSFDDDDAVENRGFAVPAPPSATRVNASQDTFSQPAISNSQMSLDSTSFDSRNDFDSSQRSFSSPHRQPSPPKQSVEVPKEIPEHLLESGDWCEVDMVIKVRRNCPIVQLHGKSLSVMKTDKDKKEVQVKVGSERYSIQFRDVVPVPPEEDSLGKVIFDANSGKFFSGDVKNVSAIEDDTVVFEDGSKALLAHCVQIS